VSEQRTFGPGEGGAVAEQARDFMRNLPRGYSATDHHSWYADGALKVVVKYWSQP